MSTRCNVVVVDGWSDPVMLYRHSDGYPDGVRPTLDRFCEWVRRGRIRNNTSQAAGWLVLLGIQEYAGAEDMPLNEVVPGRGGPSMGWKVGAYEPCALLSGDIEWLHIVDLTAGEWSSIEADAWSPAGMDRMQRIVKDRALMAERARKYG